ncbi:MAG: class I SAM-dependent methyltransferase [Chloroflexi bacterium]|nr:class I SAM-dependent methyltransferase [Chloroflexota bacterium]
MQELERIARFYDLDYGDYTDDLDLYLNLAGRTGSPVLELGVGTGRVAVALAKAGFAVTGIDSSPVMLGIAGGKVEPRMRLHLAQADMRDFHLDERFALAFFAVNTFMHLATTQDRIRCLESVHSHLERDGLLVMDLQNPDPARLAQEDKVVVLDWVRVDPATGNTVLKMVSIASDSGLQIQDVTFVYDEVDGEGVVRRTVTSFPLCYAGLPEMELLLERCGFALEAVYGSYELEEFRGESERMIVVARRAGSGRRPGGARRQRKGTSDSQ